LRDDFLTRRDAFVTLAALDRETFLVEVRQSKKIPTARIAIRNPRTEKDMAKKKLVVDLKPIKTQILKAESALKSYKSKVTPADAQKISLNIEALECLRKDVAKICKGKMTHAFSPK
jgi:hypothetical protein